MGGGQCQFHPAKTRAKDGDAGIGEAAGEEGFPLRGIGAEGFRRNGMVQRARQAGQVRGDADVDGGKVVGDGRAVGEVDEPRPRVYAGGAVKDQAGVGEAGKADEVDHQLFPPVMPGDETWQHAGVGGDGIGVDQGQPGSGQRVHRPHPQDQRMGMAAAQKDEVADRGVGGDHGARGFSWGRDVAAFGAVRLRPQGRPLAGVQS